jgi:hypothetical protein
VSDQPEVVERADSCEEGGEAEVCECQMLPEMLERLAQL